MPGPRPPNCSCSGTPVGTEEPLEHLLQVLGVVRACPGLGSVRQGRGTGSSAGWASARPSSETLICTTDGLDEFGHRLECLGERHEPSSGSPARTFGAAGIRRSTPAELTSAAVETTSAAHATGFLFILDSSPHRDVHRRPRARPGATADTLAALRSVYARAVDTLAVAEAELVSSSYTKLDNL